MKNIFIPTLNYKHFQSLIDELNGPALGVEMAAITGRAGRGKTTAATRIYTQTPNAVYLLYQELWTPNDLVREIAFALTGMRPFRRQQAWDLILSELERERKILLIDEADRAPVRALNMLRNLHDQAKTPIVMIGEDDLHRKLSMERRLISRIRNNIAFAPLTQADIISYYRVGLDLKISPQHARAFYDHSKGDFRVVLTDALKLEKAMKASSLTAVTDAVIALICKNGGRK